MNTKARPLKIKEPGIFSSRGDALAFCVSSSRPTTHSRPGEFQLRSSGSVPPDNDIIRLFLQCNFAAFSEHCQRLGCKIIYAATIVEGLK